MIYFVSTSNGVQIEKENMFDIVKELPFFNNYIGNNLEDYVKSVQDDFYLNEEFIEAVKSLNPMNFNGLFINDEIQVFVKVKI